LQGFCPGAKKLSFQNFYGRLSKPEYTFKKRVAQPSVSCNGGMRQMRANQ